MVYHGWLNFGLAYRQGTKARLLIVMSVGVALLFIGCQLSENENETHDSKQKSEDDSAVSSWGKCGPNPLAQPIPQGVYDALDATIEPGGFLHSLGYTCDAQQVSTWSEPIRSARVIEAVASAESSDASFLDFRGEDGDFFAFLLCDGQYPVGTALP